MKLLLVTFLLTVPIAIANAGDMPNLLACQKCKNRANKFATLLRSSDFVGFQCQLTGNEKKKVCDGLNGGKDDQYPSNDWFFLQCSPDGPWCKTCATRELVYNEARGRCERPCTDKVSIPQSYKITTNWEGKPIDHDPIKVTLSWKHGDDFITAVFKAPFFNDPAPPGLPGQPQPQLFNYEVVEIFLLASKSQQYLEVEVAPGGQHLVLLLVGPNQKLIEQQIPLVYSAEIDHDKNTWVGTAQIPLSYIPRGVDKMNFYAINGVGADRKFEALYPVPTGKFSYPAFHRLDYLEDFTLSSMVCDKTIKLGTYWAEQHNL